MNKEQRSFSVIHLKSKSKGQKTKEGGRYISKTPMGAALKAFNRECRQSKIKGQCSLVTILRETTSGSKHKLYRYKMRRNRLDKPKVILKDGKEIIIKYKTTAKKMKKIKPSKAMKGMMGGGRNDMDVSDDEDEGIFTGFYNIIAHNSILHTDYFLMKDEESEGKIVKKIMKKHKKDFKKAGIKDISIEIFDTMFYPREEGAKAVKSALEDSLPHIQAAMHRMSQDELKQRKKNAFDFSDIMSMLDNL